MCTIMKKSSLLLKYCFPNFLRPVYLTKYFRFIILSARQLKRKCNYPLVNCLEYTLMPSQAPDSGVTKNILKRKREKSDAIRSTRIFEMILFKLYS